MWARVRGGDLPGVLSVLLLPSVFLRGVHLIFLFLFFLPVCLVRFGREKLCVVIGWCELHVRLNRGYYRSASFVSIGLFFFF